MSNKSSSSSPTPPWEFAFMKTQEDIRRLGERMDQLAQIVMDHLTPLAPPLQTPQTHQQTPPAQAPEPPPLEPESPIRTLTPHMRRLARRPHRYEEESSHTSGSSVGVRRRRRNDHDDKGLKIDLPDFDGSLDPNDFIGWLNEIERVFEFKGYSDEMKCRITILKLKRYASLW